MTTILNFYRGGEVTVDGGEQTTLEAILTQWSDSQLEHVHDYIQWLFPLPEPSKAQPQSPVLSETDIGVFRRSDVLKNLVRRALGRMLDFYAASPFWCRPRDHNHLRITRILRFLTLVGLDAERDTFFEFLRERRQAHPSAFSDTTFWYWEEACKEHPAWLT